MTDHELIVFLLALAVLLGAARLLGELGRMWGLPIVAGELAAGLVLGPTVLGHASPRAEAWLFPRAAGGEMLRGYETVALVMLLVVVGMEVDLGVLRRRARTALPTGLLGIVLPAGAGIALGLLLPAADLADPSRRTALALLLGVALAISALPVIAKTLLDLGLFKSDVGLLVMGSAMIDDVVGWLALSLLLGPALGPVVDALAVARTAAIGVALAVVLYVAGRPLLDRLLARIERGGATAPGRIFAVVLVVALVGAAAMHAIGLHVVFGGFVAGLLVGGHGKLRARVRGAVGELVAAVFAPVVIAAVGLRVDLATSFDLPLCLLVFAVASVPKIVGSALGARAGGLRWRQATAVGFGMNARGAMGIVLAAIAYDAGLVGERMFVALVVMALGTTLLSGPTMKWLLYRAEPEEDVVTLLRRGAFVSELHAATPGDAIHELVRALGSLITGKKRDARDAVVERELTAPTGLGDEVAIPHAAIEGLTRPLLALGRSPRGIDFDAPDGRLARIVFLLLIPPRAYEEEVRILASIARATIDARGREELLAASGLDEVVQVLNRSAKRTRESMRPKRAASES